MITFRRMVGYWPDPAYPLSSNEKYTWRKLFDRNPSFTVASDKLAAKRLARELCPGIRVPRTLWEGTCAEDIPDEVLQGDIVVKANHGSGWNLFVQAGKYQRDELNRIANSWMSQRFGWRHAEWGYFGVKPRLFVEEMLLNPDGAALGNEYKTYTGANGAIALTFCRQMGDHGQRVEAVINHHGKVVAGHSETGELSANARVPAQFDQIGAVSRQPATPFDFVRVDLYVHDDQLYFSEFTLCSMGGYATMENGTVMGRLSEVWDLRRSWFMTRPQRGWRGIYCAALRKLYAQDDGPARKKQRYRD